MKVYRFDPNTNEYKGIGTASIDPVRSKKMKKDMFSFPANSTEMEPPKTKKGEVAIWDGKRWKKKKDLRGTKYWTKTGVEKTVDKIGSSIPKGAITKEPDVVITKKYAINREIAYGTIQEQLDMLYWDMMKGTSNWKNHITRVKKKFRKGK